MLAEEAVGLDWLPPNVRHGCERHAVIIVAPEVVFVNFHVVIG